MKICAIMEIKQVLHLSVNVKRPHTKGTIGEITYTVFVYVSVCWKTPVSAHLVMSSGMDPWK